MSRFSSATIIMLIAAVVASSARAQTVAMAGSYSETQGVIIHVPQNPPIVPCMNFLPAGPNARCVSIGTTVILPPPIGTVTLGAVQQPRVGNVGAQNIATIGAGPGVTGNPIGLNVGDPFRVPPLAFKQRYGTQVRIVLNNVIRQIDTAFIAAAPNTARQKNPAVLTRQFSAMNWQNPGNGQNNGLGGGTRAAATTTINRAIPNETLAMTYTPGSLEFGGTMAVLLSGGGRSYNAGPFSGIFPPTFIPMVLTIPIGDPRDGFRTQNAAGWSYTATGSRAAGRFKGFGSTPSVIAAPCGPSAPPAPPGCNEINGFDTNGVLGGFYPTAMSVKYMYALTTGTVSLVRTAIRNMITQIDTATAMGYDTVGLSSMGGPQRNVGLVAGSYTDRIESDGERHLEGQILGMDLKFTPEPGAMGALLSGLGLLGGLAFLRRR